MHIILGFAAGALIGLATSDWKTTVIGMLAVAIGGVAGAISANK